MHVYILIYIYMSMLLQYINEHDFYFFFQNHYLKHFIFNSGGKKERELKHIDIYYNSTFFLLLHILYIF
jgi:hypothetical protein